MVQLHNFCKIALSAGSTLALATAFATPYTSASYVQEGLIAQWDGIDNQGTGTHDPTATTWKDLVGHNDLSIAQGRGFEWRRGIAFHFDNVSDGKAAAYGIDGETPRYRTIEIVYKMTDWKARILFYGGIQTRYVAFDPPVTESSPFNFVYFDGATTPGTRPSPYARVKCFEPTAVAATYDDSDNVTNVFCDGVQRYNGLQANSWNPGDNRITLGWRSTSGGATCGWAGEVYAIRLYDRVLTQAEIARNHAIDERRFFTTAMYDPTGMVAFWDAKDNTGTGVHDASATTWANLVAGGQSLTVDSAVARWTDNALLCNEGVGESRLGVDRSGAVGTSPLAYNSLEILFRNERLNSSYNGFLFSNGDASSARYCVLAGGRVQWENGKGIHSFSKSNGGDHSLSWSGGTRAYIDGEETPYVAHNDSWGVGNAYVQVGGRTGGAGGQTFSGRIYSIRAYDSAIAKDKVWQNSKIDKVRYANALTWRGGDGVFGTPGNWIDVGAVQTIPGLENTVDLPPGVSKITIDQNQTVAAMRANNGCVSRGEPIDATIDMGGNTLKVVGAYQADATYGFGGDRFARLTLTNGAFQAESIAIGALSDRVVNDNGDWIAYATALSIGSGSLAMEGPGTTAAIRQELCMEGPFTKLRVAGGAELSCGAGLKVLSTRNRRLSAQPYERSLVEVTGGSTKAVVDSLYVYGDVDFNISDGADVTVNSSAEYANVVSCNISCIGRSYGFLPGNGTRMVVDNASLMLKSPGFAVGYSYSAKGGESGASLTVQNGGTLAFAGDMRRLFVGLARDNGSYDSLGSVLNVFDGATLEGGAATIEVGAAGNTSFGGINVSNAVVNCGAVYLGSKSSNSCSSNDFLHVSGTMARVDIASNGVDSLRLRMGSELRFTIPETGFAATPVVTAGGVTVHSDEENAAVDPVKLVINASAFKGNRQTLIKTAMDSTAAFQKLADNVKGKGKVTIEDGGREFVYWKDGGVLILR